MVQLLLAQLTPGLQAPPVLPAPPLLEHLLLERPLPIVILLVVAGFIASRGVARSLQRHRLALIGTALLLAAGPVLLFTSGWIQTDREHMRTAVALLVDAVAQADTAKMDRLMAPDCYLFSRFGFPGYRAGSDGMNKAAILDQVPRTIHDYPISESDVQERQALSRGPGVGTTQILVRVVAEIPGAGYKVPIQCWWRVDWKRDEAGDWRATSIEALTDPAGAAQLR